MDKQNAAHAHDEIAPIAHDLWEQQGRPEGKADEHWQEAQEMLVRGRHRRQEAEGAEPNGS
jgi:hypothetical protein